MYSLQHLGRTVNLPHRSELGQFEHGVGRTKRCSQRVEQHGVDAHRGDVGYLGKHLSERLSMIDNAFLLTFIPGKESEEIFSLEKTPEMFDQGYIAISG